MEKVRENNKMFNLQFAWVKNFHFLHTCSIPVSTCPELQTGCLVKILQAIAPQQSNITHGSSSSRKESSKKSHCNAYYVFPCLRWSLVVVRRIELLRYFLSTSLSLHSIKSS